MTPTLAGITPGGGLTMGGFLVELVGTGFQLPPEPPARGPTRAPNPSVLVTFGGQPGTRVAVVSPGRLFVIAPIQDPGVVDVVVTNIDQSGAPVPGETVVAAGAFTYALPDLTQPTDLQRLIKALLAELARQVLQNVNLVVHTDYSEDESGLDITQLAAVPAIIVTGPELRENRFFSLNQARTQPTKPGEFALLGVPRTVDLVFGIIGVTGGENGPAALLMNLHAAVERFFQRNIVLRMVRDPAGDPTDLVEYEMALTPDGEMKVATAPGASNVRHFKGECIVRGFDLDDSYMARTPGAATTDQPAPGGVDPPSAFLLDGGRVAQTGGS